MPRKLTQFRVFIASPGGLDIERKAFRDKLIEFTRLHSEDRDVIFKPIGWEDTLGGAIRPQSAINRDLEQCDCAVFLLCDRWGSPTGPDYSSGVEEEWKIAERLYETNKSFKNFLFSRNSVPSWSVTTMTS